MSMMFSVTGIDPPRLGFSSGVSTIWQSIVGRKGVWGTLWHTIHPRWWWYWGSVNCRS